MGWKVVLVFGQTVTDMGFLSPWFRQWITVFICWPQESITLRLYINNLYKIKNDQFKYIVIYSIYLLILCIYVLYWCLFLLLSRLYCLITCYWRQYETATMFYIGTHDYTFNYNNYYLISIYLYLSHNYINYIPIQIQFIVYDFFVFFTLCKSA